VSNAISKRRKPDVAGAPLMNPNAADPSDPNDAVYAHGKAWYDSFIKTTVAPLAQVAFPDQGKAYLAEKGTWDLYYNYCYTYSQSDPVILSEFCNSQYYNDWFSPLHIDKEHITINWWDAWDSVGITKQKVMEMMFGALPVGYGLASVDHLGLLPLYFVGSLFLMIYTANKTNTGFWDTIANIKQDFEDLWLKILVIWDSVGTATEKEFKDARYVLTHVAEYATITAVGLGLTYIAAYETNAFAGIAGGEAEGYEWLGGLALTVGADFLCSIFNGDFESLIKMMFNSAGKSIIGQITDFINNAFNE